MGTNDSEMARLQKRNGGKGSATGIAALVATLLGCSPATWHPARSRVPAPSILHGVRDCGPDDPECNPCATDVRGQFNANEWQHGDRDWQFVPYRRYRGTTPDEAYHGSMLDHVQGFVRLNGPSIRFAMVHSGGRKYSGQHFASLSLIEERSGGLGLSDLRSVKAVAAHTSGLFTMGHYVGLFSADGVLTMLDVSGNLDANPVEYTLPIANPRSNGISSRSGGVAMIRLAEGGYLLLANEGGDGPSSGHSHFFRLLNDLQAVSSADPSATLAVQDLGDWRYPHAHGGPADYHHSENLSLITECQTGDIYAVYVGSSRSVIKALGPLGRTFWRISRVVVSPREVTLEPIGVYTRLSSIERCFGRAAGSAFVQDDHRIDLLCHERAHFRGHPPIWHFWNHLASSPTASTSPASVPLVEAFPLRAYPPP